jgi:hypothetical protein
VRPEEFGKLIKLNDLVGSRTSDLPACSTVLGPLLYRVLQACTLRLVAQCWDHCSTACSKHVRYIYIIQERGETTPLPGPGEMSGTGTKILGELINGACSK